MTKCKLLLFKFFVLLILSHSLFAGEGFITKANNIALWAETFGHKQDRPLLLIMGGCCQGILWPTEFCERLAKQGFYVIRYDNRDTGQSSHFDFEKNPYDLMDMTKDAVGLLDTLGIEKAHVVGLSMGGPIAELMAVHYPSYVQSITLIATSCDFRPMNLAYAGLPEEENALPKTKEVYLAWMKDFQKNVPSNEEEALKQRVECWRILNGTVFPFDEEFNRILHKQFMDRQKDPESMKNHLFVCKNSEHLIKEVPAQVKVPALILHGSEDSIFPAEHGLALAKSISGSKYVPVHGFGHVLNSQLYDLMIREIVSFSKDTEK